MMGSGGEKQEKCRPLRTARWNGASMTKSVSRLAALIASQKPAGITDVVRRVSARLSACLLACLLTDGKTDNGIY